MNLFKRKTQGKCDETAVCAWKDYRGQLYANRKEAERSNYEAEIRQNRQEFNRKIEKISIGNPATKVLYGGNYSHCFNRGDQQNVAKEIGAKLLELFDLDEWYQVLQVVTDYKYKEEQITEKYKQWL